MSTRLALLNTHFPVKERLGNVGSEVAVCPDIVSIFIGWEMTLRTSWRILAFKAWYRIMLIVLRTQLLGKSIATTMIDLYQEGMMAAFRLLERKPTSYGRTLLRLSVLAMYAARKRGRSVFRADPAHRQRFYEQVFFEQETEDAELTMLADGELVASAGYELDW